MPRVAVSIINYRTEALTIACIASVLAERETVPELEVVVVDNASGDGSADGLERWIVARPDVPVRLIRAPVNGGFSSGHNLAIAATDAPYVLLLNSDAQLHPGCLAALVAAADAAPDAGFAAPRIVGEDGVPQTNAFRFPGPLSELIRGAMTGPVTALLKHWDVPLGAAPDPARIQWLSFACVLLRREMIDAIGPMDTGYFLYFEDIEYCRRAAKAGWGIAHVPDASAMHRIGGSGPVEALKEAHRRLPPYYYASRTRYFYQSGGWVGLLLANLGWLLGRLVALMRVVTPRGVPPATVREGVDIWTNVFTPLAASRR